MSGLPTSCGFLYRQQPPGVTFEPSISWATRSNHDSFVQQVSGISGPPASCLTPPNGDFDSQENFGVNREPANSRVAPSNRGSQVASRRISGCTIFLESTPDIDAYYQEPSGSRVTQSTLNNNSQNASQDNSEPWTPHSKLKRGRHVSIVLRNGRSIEGLTVAVRCPCGCLLAIRPKDPCDSKVYSSHILCLDENGPDVAADGYLNKALFFHSTDLHSITIFGVTKNCNPNDQHRD